MKEHVLEKKHVPAYREGISAHRQAVGGSGHMIWMPNYSICADCCFAGANKGFRNNRQESILG